MRARCAETIAAILNEEPPAIPQVTLQISPALQRVVRRCLEKNPEQRFQSASDLAFALEALSDSGALNPSTATQVDLTSRKNRYLKTAAVALVELGIIAGAYAYFHRPAKLTEKDTIVLADFANSAGDPIFDDTLKQALVAALRQAPFLKVLSDNRVAATLQLMTRPPNTPLTPEITREICQRADGKAWIGGSISSVGTEYIIGLYASCPQLCWRNGCTRGRSPNFPAEPAERGRSPRPLPGYGRHLRVRAQQMQSLDHGQAGGYRFVRQIRADKRFSVPGSSSGSQDFASQPGLSP